jgi:ABC-2 type transport system permease protein
MARIGARLNDTLPPISASQQFKAIAYLRWRLFANSFRRKGGVGELVARIIVYPIGLLLLIGPTLGAGFGAWAAVANNKPQVLGLLFWAITALQIFVSINLSPPGLSFDPESLIRFPVTFSRYLIVRLFLGLLSPATIVGTCALLAAAVGTSVARPELGPIAFTAAILLAVVNVLFIRMIFAWVDRWLSTRRARELFTGLILFLSVGFQWVNVNFNPAFSRHGDRAERVAKLAALHRFYQAAQAILSRLPAGLAGVSIVDINRHANSLALANLLAVAVYGALFLAVFAWRMHREYRGENTSDTVASAAETRAKVCLAYPRPSFNESRATSGGLSLPPVLTACFFKEWVYIQRNTTQFFALLVPLAMVFLFAGRVGSNRMFADWTFPVAVVYATLAVGALAYNSLGLDAEGVQLYFIAPIRFRTIMLAKNLFGFALILAQTVVIYVVLCFVATRPPLIVTVATAIWLVFAILANVTIGNIRSILAPKKMDPSKLSRKQASQLSALISVVTILVLGVIGGAVFALGVYVETPWLPIPIFVALAAGAFACYSLGLNRVDELAQANRENMIEELSKAS